MAIKGWSILISLYIESTLTFLIQNFAHSFNCEAGPESTFKQYQEKMFELTYHLLVIDSEGIKLNGINVSILLLIIGLNLYLKYIIFTFFFYQKIIFRIFPVWLWKCRPWRLRAILTSVSVKMMNEWGKVTSWSLQMVIVGSKVPSTSRNLAQIQLIQFCI